MKLCTKCKKTKPLTEFSKSKKEKQYVQYRCKECNKVYREQRKEHVKDYHLRRSFGLSLADYQKMFDEQQGVCKICNESDINNKKLAVDHCHTTGKIRGLLCGSCNRGLGYFRDNEDLLIKAATYLKEQE